MGPNPNGPLSNLFFSYWILRFQVEGSVNRGSCGSDFLEVYKICLKKCCIHSFGNNLTFKKKQENMDVFWTSRDFLSKIDFSTWKL